MSSITTYCPTCGHALESEFGGSCPRCATPSTPAPAQPQADKRWGIGTGLLVWLGSVVLLFGFQIIAIVIYFVIKVRQTGGMPKTFEIDWLNATLSIASTFPAHLLTLLLCWLVVTRVGKRPFWQTLGWRWHSQFKWVHAVGLAFLMMGLAYLLEKLLPHKETDLEKLLKLGASVRVMVAALAVLTAPLVEEVVYRGVLYSGIERVWGKAAGVVLVTFLFALVHVPQYWGSYAAITAIVSLSLVLTLLRAATGGILPCVATHLVYNGVQAVALLAAPDKMPEGQPAQVAVTIICRWFGL
jgi:membrane protease YdiL (CAAX protease family)